MSALVFVVLAPIAGSAGAAPPRRAAPIEPNPTEIAVYVPPGELTARSYMVAGNTWIEPGKALSEALSEVGQGYFPTLHVVPGEGSHRYGLLVDLAPRWKAERGKAILTLQYQVYDSAGGSVLEGSSEQQAPIRALKINAALEQASIMAVQQVMAQIQDRLKPDPARFPAEGETATIDFAPLVDREKPFRTGTAFFVNTAGQLLTAAHLSRDCVVLEAHDDQTSFPVTIRNTSELLDIAVLESGRHRDAALALRQGHELVLGEAVTSVGYPLKGFLGDSAQVTRGNVSSSKGLRGSMGMFQFSAPIQPGNSGGPVVSDNGELLGMTVSTLNAASLAEHGHIPQNVNFALDARHIARFLERAGIGFGSILAEGVGGLQTANQAALSNTVQLNCYQ